MGDVAWGGVLLTGALWVVRPVWRWRNVRRLGKLVIRWRRSLRHAPQPAKAAEVNAAPVALDDLGLEGQLPQPGHLQLDLAGPGVQGARVAAGAGVEAVGGALVAPGVAEAVGLGVEQGVEGLRDRVADDLIEVLVQLALVDLDHVAEGRGHGRVRFVTHGRSPGVTRFRYDNHSSCQD